MIPHAPYARVLRKSGVLIRILTCVLVAGPIACQTRPAGKAVPHPARLNSEKRTGSRTESTESPALQPRNRRYQLHSADVLELSFSFTPDFNQTVTVQPDGYITLRGLESIHVEGQTIPDVTKAIQTAYAKILRDPVVSVEVKDFETPSFIVGGEVGSPGKFDLRQETTVTEAVAIAGGLKDSAKHSQVLLFRRTTDGWVQTRKIDMKGMLRELDLSEDAYLRPGDFIYVPKNTRSKIDRFIPTSALGLYANPVVP